MTLRSSCVFQSCARLSPQKTGYMVRDSAIHTLVLLDPSLPFFLPLAPFTLVDSVGEGGGGGLIPSIFNFSPSIWRPCQDLLLLWNSFCQWIALPAPSQPNPSLGNYSDPPFPRSQCPLAANVLTIFTPLLSLDTNLVQTLGTSHLDPVAPSSLASFLQFTPTPLHRAFQFSSGFSLPWILQGPPPACQRLTLLSLAPRPWWCSSGHIFYHRPLPPFTPGRRDHLQLPTSIMNTSCLAHVIFSQSRTGIAASRKPSQCPKYD